MIGNKRRQALDLLARLGFRQERRRESFRRGLHLDSPSMQKLLSGSARFSGDDAACQHTRHFFAALVQI
jgi:hypothetical protein